MTKYREIIRLTGLGFSQRNIMASCGVSQKTVVKVQKRARELNISWPLDESMTDTELQKLMFSKESKVSANKRIPDYAYIRKELLRNGVSKKLLWTEYMEDCRANGDEPLMYSQFCYHIQQDEQKHRATMHINRKPGEQVEVDWAGDPATIIDPDTGEIIKGYIFVGVMTYSQYAYDVLYNMMDSTEYEANLFAADLLLEDDDVAEMSKNEDLNYFSFCSSLDASPELMSFKLYSLMMRGQAYHMPMEIQSNFLAK